MFLNAQVKLLIKYSKQYTARILFIWLKLRKKVLIDNVKNLFTDPVDKMYLVIINAYLYNQLNQEYKKSRTVKRFTSFSTLHWPR